MSILQFEIDEQLKRIIQTQAKLLNLPVEEYLLAAVKEKLERSTSDSKTTQAALSSSLLTQMHRAREAALNRRHNQPIQEDLVSDIRGERDEEFVNDLLY